jgi:DNA primase
MVGGTAQAVKEKLDIVEFLKGYLDLQPAGRNFKARCPFHKEKTPSFMISPERQSWHCFGCSLGGDIFEFIMRHDNLEFGEALKILADKAGVELRRVSPAEYEQFGLLYDLNSAAKDFFVKQLTHFKLGQEYLKERGLTPETIEEFEVGWAPTDPEALNLHFLNLGFRPEAIVRAGLAIKTERGMQLDRFRGRIMFPIHNHLGKVVGFTGRILPSLDKGDMGKYVNSPETPIFQKSKLLYGFWKTKNNIRESGSAFMVEGQMDFLMSWQAGIKNVVATSGTALTPDHLNVLRRLTERLVLCFDSDEAGRDAAERAIDLAEKSDYNVKIATLGEYKDPAEAAQKDPETLKGAILAAKAATQIYLERYLPYGRYNFSERENLRNLRTVISKVMNIASPVERDYWIKELARYTALDEGIIREEAAHLPEVSVKSESKPPEEAQKAGILPRRELLSRNLISAVVALQDFTLMGNSAEYLTHRCQEIFKIVAAGGKSTADTELDGILNTILMNSETIPIPEIQELKEYLKSEFIKERREKLTLVVKNAEALGNESELLKALTELRELPVI